jgi:hypothetical protein
MRTQRFTPRPLTQVETGPSRTRFFDQGIKLPTGTRGVPLPQSTVCAFSSLRSNSVSWVVKTSHCLSSACDGVALRCFLFSVRRQRTNYLRKLIARY